jgi:hypothetical protein
MQPGTPGVALLAPSKGGATLRYSATHRWAVAVATEVLRKVLRYSLFGGSRYQLIPFTSGITTSFGQPLSVTRPVR